MRRLAPVLLLLGAGCARERSARSAEELLPDPAQGALSTAPLAGLAQDASALLQRAAQLPGGEQLGDGRRSVAAQLGFDPLSRDGQLAAGLDPDRAAALVLLPAQGGPGWVAALPLTKPDVFAQAVDRLLRERAAFAVRHDEARGRTRVAVYSREGETDRVAFAVVRGYAVLARGPDPAADVAATAERPLEQSLAHDAKFAAARKQLGGQDLTLFAPAGSGLLRRITSRTLPGDLAIGLTSSSGGLTGKLFFQAPPADAQRIQAMLPGGGGSLVRFLPPDAPLVMRAGLQPAELLRQARRVPELAQILAQLGGPVADEIAASLLPGAAVSVALAPHPNLGTLLDFGLLDWRQHSPFETFQVVALAPVGDRARLERALTKVAAALPKLGAKVTNRISAGMHSDVFAGGWEVRYRGGPGPQFGIASLEDKTVAYLVGGGIDLSELNEKPSVPVLEGDAGVAVHLDFAKLAERIRALPDTAYGSGPQAYVARSVVSQVVEPLAALRLIATAVPGEQGVNAEIRLAIAAGKP